MRADKCIMSFLLILVFLNLTTGCYYYKVNTKTELIPEDIRWEDFNKKYFILHYGDSAWQMSNISVDTSSLYCSISALPDNHKMYLKTDPEKPNKFIKGETGYEGDVLNEVHLYTSDLLQKNDSNISAGFSSLERIEIYSFDAGKSRAVRALPIVIPLGAATAALIIIGIIALLTKSSCPYVYVMEGETFRFAGEIYSGAIYSSLERNDYLPLPRFEPNNDRYTLKIANRLPEIQYINQAELWVVDHPASVGVIADRYGEIHTLQTVVSPNSSISSGGEDLTGILSERDQEIFLFNEEPYLTGDTKAKNSVVLTFSIPAGQQTGKLVINAKNSYWGDYVVGEFTKYFGNKYGDWVKQQGKAPPEKPLGWKKDQGLVLMVYLETSDGWQFIDYFDMTGPLAYREMVMPVGLADGIKNINDTLSQVRIKIESGFMFWELDFAGMDFSRDEPVVVSMISPSSAISETGKDVMKLLSAGDRKYYIQPTPGNEVVLEFNGPPEQKDKERTVILHTRGYYEHVRHYPGPPDRESLEAFRIPGRLSEFSLERFLEAKKNISMKSIPESR
jgi:hypothetical protein